MRDTVITNLTEVSNKKYEGMTSLLYLYREIHPYLNFIKSAIDTELYESLKIECDTCHKEFQYGDGEYSENVFNDCIEVIKEVIIVL